MTADDISSRLNKKEDNQAQNSDKKDRSNNIPHIDRDNNFPWLSKDQIDQRTKMMQDLMKQKQNRTGDRSDPSKVSPISKFDLERLAKRERPLLPPKDQTVSENIRPKEDFKSHPTPRPIDGGRNLDSTDGPLQSIS